MRTVTGLGLVSLTLVVLAGWPSPRAHGQEGLAPAPRYRVKVLGIFPDRGRTMATDLNDRGVIVGEADNYDDAGAVALVWRDGKPVRLPAPAGYRAIRATAVNAAGQIAGSVEKTYHGTRYVSGCLWTNGKPQLLPTPRGHFGTATDVNATGTVVGWSMVGIPPGPRAWRWREGKLTLLPLPPGRTVTRECSVNEAGQIAGIAEGPNLDASSSAVLWDQDRLTVLPSPLGLADATFQIDNRGRVVGSAGNGEGECHAALWEGGRMRNLGTLGGSVGFACSINNRGQVVGSTELEVKLRPGSNFIDPDERAFYWEDGKMHDLNALIPRGSEWKLVAATAINNRGEILATGRRNNAQRPVLLTPIPSPGNRKNAVQSQRRLKWAFTRPRSSSDLTTRAERSGSAAWRSLTAISTRSSDEKCVDPFTTASPTFLSFAGLFCHFGW